MYQLSVRKRERKREETENQTGDDEQKNAWRFCSDTQGESVMKEKGKVLPKRVACEPEGETNRREFKELRNGS